MSTDQQPDTRTLDVLPRWEPYGGGQYQLRLHLSEPLIDGPSAGEKHWPAVQLAPARSDGKPPADGSPWQLTRFGTVAVSILDQSRGLEALTVARYQLRLLPGLAWTTTDERRDAYAEVAVRAVRTAWVTTGERPA